MDSLYSNLPASPGIYLMKDKDNNLLYVGKAGNLKRRVSSYFTRSLDDRLSSLVSNIHHIDFIETETAIEALIKEAEFIKKFKPQFNIKDKDDKSFLFVEITKEAFPRVLLVRGNSPLNGFRFGPFTEASKLREALRIVRKLFPYSIHPSEKNETFEKPCFDFDIGLCPGTCVKGLVSKKDYLINIKNIKLFFSGKKEKIVSSLEKEMISYSKKLEFEKALAVKKKIFALKHIQDIALISSYDNLDKEALEYRIEGYDISNIFGDKAVGSMVVFYNDKPSKKDYRLFKIKSITGINDVGMMREIVKRRLDNPWPLPQLILIDGGIGQVNAIRSVLNEAGVNLPIIGLAKGKERKRNDLIGDSLPKEVSLETLIKVRDEAHRFAIGYHRRLRNINIDK